MALSMTNRDLINHANVQPYPVISDNVVEDPVSSDAGTGTSDDLSTAEQFVTNYIEKLGFNGLFGVNTPEGWSKMMAEGLSSGELTLDDVLSITNRAGMSFTPEFEKYINNLTAEDSAQKQFDREIYARDTSLISSYNQLQGLGLNTAGVLDVGGAKAGVSASKGDVDMSNNSFKRSQDRFNRNTLMAKTMLGLIGGMASAGIYGGSMSMAKNSVAKLTTAASKEAARIRSSGQIAAAQMRLKHRVTGRSRFNGKGEFMYHDTYDY